MPQIVRKSKVSDNGKSRPHNFGAHWTAPFRALRAVARSHAANEFPAKKAGRNGCTGNIRPPSDKFSAECGHASLPCPPTVTLRRSACTANRCPEDQVRREPAEAAQAW